MSHEDCEQIEREVTEAGYMRCAAGGFARAATAARAVDGAFLSNSKQRKPMGRAEDLVKRISELGEAAVDELILNRQSEELWLDFKRAATNASSKKLHGDDRRNLARAISGFGNSEGGIVIWGVECTNDSDEGDVAKSKVPIEKVARFKSLLEGVTSGCSIPPHSGVEHFSIGLPNGSGFVVTHIQQSTLAPLQPVVPGEKLSFYLIRAGSSFIPAPHGVLAGLFGRPPQPILLHKWVVPPARKPADGIIIEGSLALYNQGPGLARDLFLNVHLFPPKGPSTVVISALKNPEHWICENLGDAGTVQSYVSKDGYKLAPTALAEIVKYHMVFSPPFASDYILEVSYGHGHSAVTTRREEVTAKELEQLYVGAGKSAVGIKRFQSAILGAKE